LPYSTQHFIFHKINGGNSFFALRWDPANRTDTSLAARLHKSNAKKFTTEMLKEQNIPISRLLCQPSSPP